MSLNHPQPFAHIPIHEKELMESDLVLRLSIMKCKIKIMLLEMMVYTLSFVLVYIDHLTLNCHDYVSHWYTSYGCHSLYCINRKPLY